MVGYQSTLGAEQKGRKSRALSGAGRDRGRLTVAGGDDAALADGAAVQHAWLGWRRRVLSEPSAGRIRNVATRPGGGVILRSFPHLSSCAAVTVVAERTFCAPCGDKAVSVEICTEAGVAKSVSESRFRRVHRRPGIETVPGALDAAHRRRPGSRPAPASSRPTKRRCSVRARPEGRCRDAALD
jgi:hypothetical protein